MELVTPVILTLVSPIKRSVPICLDGLSVLKYAELVVKVIPLPLVALGVIVTPVSYTHLTLPTKA